MGQLLRIYREDSTHEIIDAVNDVLKEYGLRFEDDRFNAYNRDDGFEMFELKEKLKMSLIDQKIEKLKTPDGGDLKLTPEQEKVLHFQIAYYALCACLSSGVRKEALSICLEETEEKGT